MFSLFLLALVPISQACTTFIVGKGATVDGSVMATHTNDGGGTTDPRLVKVAAQDYAPGSMRAIFGSPESYPRYVGRERNIPQYYAENCEAGELRCKDFEPLGYIPQVEHTYAYFEATYGIINEHQVGLGESTCSSVFVAAPLSLGGKALLSIDQLSQIAMERAKTAREAVTIMGDLAVEYGFYGESTSFEGGAESLMVIDPLEAWVFHILADPTGSSAIWVAARVPDNGVAVVANMFSIREIDLDDGDNYLGSSNMWSIAAEHGLWSEGQPKDFTKTFSDGEYAHKYYSGRRMWGVFRLLAASQNLPSEYGNLKDEIVYPFSVPVDKLVSVTDMFAVLRDWYNNTEYSTSAVDNLAGGAFMTPDRYSGGAGESQVPGSWERTIALFRSSDTYVVQARNYIHNNEFGGVLWFGPHAAHGTVYVPLLVGMREAPSCLSWAYQGVFNMSTSFWAHRNVLNLAQSKFVYMLEDIRAVQGNLENSSIALLEHLTLPIERKGNSFDKNIISSALTLNAEKARDEYIKLLQNLLFKYADGYINTWNNGRFQSSGVGYPAWWLESVGYTSGPPPTAKFLQYQSGQGH